MKINRIRGDFGAEVSDVDIAGATDEELAALVDLYRQGSVLVVRDQKLTPEQLVRFGEMIGGLENHTREQFTLPGFPTVYILSNKEVDGKRIGVHRDGMGWHTDGSYLRVPLDTTVLYALETPPEGGDTLLADMHSAYMALDPETREKIGDYEVLHSFVFLIGRLDPEARSVVTQEQRDRAPDVTHPLVLTRKDGRKSLYLSNGSTKEILGMPEKLGRDLVADLIEHATDKAHVYRHEWREGDVLLWNNRYTMHRATPYDDKTYERLVYRLWVRGEEELAA